MNPQGDPDTTRLLISSFVWLIVTVPLLVAWDRVRDRTGDGPAMIQQGGKLAAASVIGLILLMLVAFVVYPESQARAFQSLETLGGLVILTYVLAGGGVGMAVVTLFEERPWVDLHYRNIVNAYPAVIFGLWLGGVLCNRFPAMAIGRWRFGFGAFVALNTAVGAVLLLTGTSLND